MWITRWIPLFRLNYTSVRCEGCVGIERLFDRVAFEVPANPTVQRELSTVSAMLCTLAQQSYPQLICVGAALFDEVRYLGDLVVDRTTLFHEVGNLLIGVHHGRVIAPTKELPNLGQ
jgi:hypothetical protein